MAGHDRSGDRGGQASPGWAERNEARNRIGRKGPPRSEAERLSRSLKPDFPQPIPGTEFHYNFADVMAALFGYKEGAERLYATLVNPDWHLIYSQEQINILVGECNRIYQQPTLQATAKSP